jgi:hypothetical protein
MPRKGASFRKINNPPVKFMDPTGSILASMDGKCMEKFGHEMVPGTAIAVTNVSPSSNSYIVDFLDGSRFKR